MKGNVAVVILALVLLGGWWYTSHRMLAPLPDPADVAQHVIPTGHTVTVTSTDEFGFSPHAVTIQPGDAVEFKNDGSHPIWPAAAVHPTHSLYPLKSATDCLGSSFDACKGVPPGESWTFVFLAEGEWRYHDHLEASRTGVITVTP